MLQSYGYAILHTRGMNPMRYATNDRHNLASLESAIALLENTEGNLSPVQLQSLHLVAQDCGATLGHHQAGLGMEAYTGDRARQMRTLTIENFKETATKLREKVEASEKAATESQSAEPVAEPTVETPAEPVAAPAAE
jgi:hypothetical protein